MPPGPDYRVPLRLRITSWLFRLRWKVWGRFTVPFIRLLFCPRPFHHAMTLLWPFPWKFPVPPQLSVSELMEDRGIIMRRKSDEVNYTELRYVPLWCIRDTQLRALYRLYECACTLSDNEMMEESMYYFHDQPHWRIKDIPDPKDPDPLRHAMLASLAETLVMSFNHKINLGLRRGITNRKPLLIRGFQHDPNPPLEEVPPWCSTVGPLVERLELHPKMVNLRYSEHFEKRNIIADASQMWNI